MPLTFRKSTYWTPCSVALVAFAAGLFTAGRISRPNEVRADSNRVFELRIYHALPGKLPAMESRFRDTTSKLLVRHNLNVIGYWIPDSKSPPLGQYFRLKGVRIGLPKSPMDLSRTTTCTSPGPPTKYQ